MTASVVFLWAAVSIPTARGFWTGSLFQAPCLIKLPELLQAVDREKQKEPENGQTTTRPRTPGPAPVPSTTTRQ